MKQHDSSQSAIDSLKVILVCSVLVLLPSCVKQERKFVHTNSKDVTSTKQSTQKININTATQKELETLPVIGKEMANRIVEYRNQYGRFRRTEHLLLIRGMSDKKFRALREFIIAE